MSQRFFGALALIMLVGLSSCGAPPTPVDVTTEQSPAHGPTALTLERAEPAEVLVVAEQLLGEPVLVEAMAVGSLRCMSITVKEAAMPPREAAARLFDALRAQGLRVQRERGAWTVGIDASRPPVACAKGRATAASEAIAARGEAARGEPADDAAILQEVLASIREISPTEHAVKRRGLDLFLEHQDMLMRSARMVPEVSGGKSVGVRIFGVRPDGLLGKLGFENGDRIERVMGKPLTDPESALAIYASMRGAKEIPIEIIRRGTPTKLLVHIE